MLIFLRKVIAARVTDGDMVVVDNMMGRVLSNLFVDKVERCTLELQLEPGDMYNRFWSAPRNVNVIFAAYNDALKGDVQVMRGL